MNDVRQHSRLVTESVVVIKLFVPLPNRKPPPLISVLARGVSVEEQGSRRSCFLEGMAWDVRVDSWVLQPVLGSWTGAWQARSTHVAACEFFLFKKK